MSTQFISTLKHGFLEASAAVVVVLLLIALARYRASR